MKKIMFFMMILSVTGCMKSEKPDNGLRRLSAIPQNCEFLYEIKSQFSGYSAEDAYDFVEKRIVEENGFGDSYYIANEDILENEGAIFGPKNTYKIKAMVYNCKK